MATHTQLPIYKAAYDLLDVSTDFVKNMQRDFKRSIGEKITNECIEITIAVFRANVARDKEPHLMDLLERLQVVELRFEAGNHAAPQEKKQARLISPSLIGQASHPHTDRARLANALLARGHCVKSDLTKIYRKARK